MTKKMNAVFICRDKLDDKDNYYGFVVYEGDDPIIKEMYDKISEKLGFTKNNENELTLPAPRGEGSYLLLNSDC